jgi:hypothetical protein
MIPPHPRPSPPLARAPPTLGQHQAVAVGPLLLALPLHRLLLRLELLQVRPGLPLLVLQVAPLAGQLGRLRVSVCVRVCKCVATV